MCVVHSQILIIFEIKEWNLSIALILLVSKSYLKHFKEQIHLWRAIDGRWIVVFFRLQGPLRTLKGTLTTSDKVWSIIDWEPEPITFPLNCIGRRNIGAEIRGQYRRKRFIYRWFTLIPEHTAHNIIADNLRPSEFGGNSVLGQKWSKLSESLSESF